MICVPYTIATSLINHAGRGLFIKQAVPAGKIIIAPSHIQETFSLRELHAQSHHDLRDSSARWFEDHYTLSPDWPDECYVNHAFDSTGLWHLGFIFALNALPAGAEITVDYRHLLAPGNDIGFADSVTGRRIVGFTWLESLRISTLQLNNLLNQLPSPLENYP